MLIFVPLGEDVKEAAEALRLFRLERCPCCGTGSPDLADVRRREVPVGIKRRGAGPAERWAEGAREEEVVHLGLPRYRCHRRACRTRITVAPDCLVRGGVYALTVRDLVAEAYLEQRCTYQQIAAAVGCSRSTAWRWMRALALRAGSWLEACRQWLAAEGEPAGEVAFRDDLRLLWRLRRVRAPGMLEGLLTAEALSTWIARLRAAWRYRGRVLPRGRWGLGCHVLAVLAPTDTPQAESRRPP